MTPLGWTVRSYIPGTEPYRVYAAVQAWLVKVDCLLISVWGADCPLPHSGPPPRDPRLLTTVIEGVLPLVRATATATGGGTPDEIRSVLREHAPDWLLEGLQT